MHVDEDSDIVQKVQEILDSKKIPIIKVLQIGGYEMVVDAIEGSDFPLEF